LVERSPVTETGGADAAKEIKQTTQSRRVLFALLHDVSDLLEQARGEGFDDGGHTPYNLQQQITKSVSPLTSDYTN